MPRVELNARSLISPLGVVRFFEIFLSCTAFSLVAVNQSYGGSYGAWSMFTWCFCFAVSIIVVLVELVGLSESLPVSWQDFISAFSMLASLMIFTTSILYPSVFIPSNCKSRSCSYEAAATAMSCFCFVAYAVEVGLTRARPGEISGFLSTVPGLLKVFEAYVACLIFALVGYSTFYSSQPGLQWCLAVYCICFIITLFIIILTIGRCLASLPLPLDKALVGYNLLAVLMYVTVAVMWPLYSFRNYPRPSCSASNLCGEWNNRLGITFLTYFNLIAYVVDLVYSTKMVFFTTSA